MPRIKAEPPRPQFVRLRTLAEQLDTTVDAVRAWINRRAARVDWTRKHGRIDRDQFWREYLK